MFLKLALLTLSITLCQSDELRDENLEIAKKTLQSFMSSMSDGSVGSENSIMANHFRSELKFLSEMVFRQKYIEELKMAQSKFILYEIDDLVIHNATRKDEVIKFFVNTKDYEIEYTIKLFDGQYKILLERILKSEKRPYLTPLLDEEKTFKFMSNYFSQQYLKALQLKSRRTFKNITTPNYRVLCNLVGLAVYPGEYFNKYLMAQEYEEDFEFRNEYEYDWEVEVFRFAVYFSTTGKVVFSVKLQGGPLLLAERRRDCLKKKELARNDEILLDEFQTIVDRYVDSINKNNQSEFCRLTSTPFTIIDELSIRRFSTMLNFSDCYSIAMPELFVTQVAPKITPLGGLSFNVTGEWVDLSFDACEVNGTWLLTTERRGVNWEQNSDINLIE